MAKRTIAPDLSKSCVVKEPTIIVLDKNGKLFQSSPENSVKYRGKLVAPNFVSSKDHCLVTIYFRTGAMA